MLQITTNRGLHEFVGERVLARFTHTGLTAADLGARPGAMAARLRSLGSNVLAADRDAKGGEAGLPHLSIDLNQPEIAFTQGLNSFSMVTAIEVILHVKSPIGFLRNVDSLSARLKFFLTGKTRTMDQYGELTPISQIFFDLLKRQYLPLTWLRLREPIVFAPRSYGLTRKPIAWSLCVASAAFSGDSLLGDNHVFVLEAT
jgi:hypothetical protein